MILKKVNEKKREEECTAKNQKKKQEGMETKL
jgi:hypothetical protein